MRGGSGLYDNDILNTNVLWPQSPLTIAVIRGQQRRPAGLRREPVQRTVADLRRRRSSASATSTTCPGACCATSRNRRPFRSTRTCTHAWQNSIGVAQQFGTFAALQVDYVNTKSRDEKSIQDNVNVTFNPATGVPYPYLGRRASRLSAVRRRRDDSDDRQVRLPRIPDQLHQAYEPPLAGFAHLHAVGPLGPGPASAQRVHTGHRSRWRRILATNGRSRKSISGIGWCSTASGRSATASR